MGYIGGDVTSIEYNHPTLGSGTLFCKSNEDGTLDPGGYRSNDDANSVTGDGEFIDQLNRVRGSYESPPIAWDMLSVDELTVLSDMAESPVLADWVIAHVSGVIWGGKGKPTGDIQGNTNTAQIGLKLGFRGKVKQVQ